MLLPIMLWSLTRLWSLSLSFIFLKISLVGSIFIVVLKIFFHVYFVQALAELPTPVTSGTVLTIEDLHQEWSCNINIKHRSFFDACTCSLSITIPRFGSCRIWQFCLVSALVPYINMLKGSIRKLPSNLDK